MLSTMVPLTAKKTEITKEPTEGIEPSIYRLRSGCLATWPCRQLLHFAIKNVFETGIEPVTFCV
jgi:hypothetical protein